ncbi:MAG: hypothetical protein WCH11_01040 [Bdellovibrio sp.]
MSLAKMEIKTLFLFAILALAEYRAFWLKIETAEKKSFRSEISSLDPLQYPSYYPLNPGETIVYIDTWMCKGRTGPLERPCRSPRESEILAALEAENQRLQKERELTSPTNP